MGMIQNPQTGEWEWDYNDGPYDGAPFDPATGNPYDPSMLPAGVSLANPNDPNSYWNSGGWNTGAPKPNTDDPTQQPTGETDPQAPPPPSTGGAGGFSYNGDGTFPNTSPSTFEVSPSWPQLTLPRFEPGPGFEAPPPFSYQDFSYDSFHAPTMEQARNEPGYAFAADEGRRALENSAAARGVVRTGGTLKDILGWGQRLGDQNYSNVYNREASTYGLNRGNAFGNWEANRNNAADAYQRNYNVSRDVFDANYGQRKDKYAFDVGAVKDEFAPRQRQAELTFADLYSRWRDQLNSLTSVATAGAGA